MGGLGGLNKANSTIAHVAGGLVGIVSFINTSSAKFTGLSFTQKSIFTASQVLGPDLTWALIGGTGRQTVTINNVSVSRSQLPLQSINPWGAFNTTTYGGVALLIVSWVLNEFVDGKYGISYAMPWFRSVGAGLTFGGIVGGIFDPATPGIQAGGTGLFAPSASIGYAGGRGSGASFTGGTPFGPARGY